MSNKIMNKHNPKTLAKAKKAFALVSYTFAMVKDAKLSTLKSMALVKQCKASMQGFHRAVGNEIYMENTDDLGNLYLTLNKRFEERISSNETLVFIEIILNLLTKKDMKDFMLMNFNSGYRLDDARMDILIEKALELDDELNTMLGTAKTASTESLKSLFTPKEVKEKKVRDKKPSKKALAHQKAVEEAQQKKAKKQEMLSSLRERARIARENIKKEQK